VPLTGRYCLADADAVPPIPAVGIALTTASLAGIAIDVLKKGDVDINGVGDGIAYGGDVFFSGTPGRLADAAVGGFAAIGMIVPAFGTVVPDKILRIDL
jgi:hypothetical protein